MLLPEKFRGYDIASVIILGPTQCISEARQQSHLNEYLRYPFCPLRRTPLVSAFRSDLHTLHR